MRHIVTADAKWSAHKLHSINEMNARFWQQQQEPVR
jgi:hypothetical protein